MSEWVDMQGNPAPEELRPMLDAAGRILDDLEDDPEWLGETMPVDELIALLREKHQERRRREQ